MKHLILLLALTVPPAAAMPAVVGSVAPDIAFCTGTTVTNNTFNSLTNSQYSAHEGKIIALCYYTPW